MPGGSHRRLILDLAMTQLGIVTRRQLLAIPVSSGLITHWLATDRLFTVFRGVYSVGRPASGDESFWMASVLRAGDGAVLSGRSAATAWGMMDSRRTLEVGRPKGRVVHANTAKPHASYHLIVRKLSLDGPERTRIGPITVTTPGRTLVDLAGVLDDRALRRAFLNAGRSGLLKRDVLCYITERGSFRGRERLADLVDQWLPDTGRLSSPMESEFLLLCGKYGVPAPLTNHRLGRFEADCYWPGTSIVAELDSRTFHDDGFGFEDDREKGNALSLQGFTVLRFTRLMITERPAEVARMLRSHLGLSRD